VYTRLDEQGDSDSEHAKPKPAETPDAAEHDGGGKPDAGSGDSGDD
jgi:hypothetical protein